MKVLRHDWERVMQKACDITNATECSGDPMYEVHLEGMLTLLDELEAKYGPQSKILATRADYIADLSKRRALYQQALILAQQNQDVDEIEEVMDSINQLGNEVRAQKEDQA